MLSLLKLYVLFECILHKNLNKTKGAPEDTCIPDFLKNTNRCAKCHSVRVISRTLRVFIMTICEGKYVFEIALLIMRVKHLKIKLIMKLAVTLRSNRAVDTKMGPIATPLFSQNIVYSLSS